MDRQPRPRPERHTVAGAISGVARPRTAPADGGAMRRIRAAFRIAAPHEFRTAVVMEHRRRDDRSHDWRDCADSAGWRGRRTDPGRRGSRGPAAPGGSSWPSGGASETRRREAGNFRLPSSRNDLGESGCVPERTGLGSGRGLTTGPIAARAPDGTSGRRGATTKGGPEGIAREDRPARGHQRTGVASRCGVARGQISVVGRLPKRNEMRRHDLSQPVVEERLAVFHSDRRYEMGTKWTEGTNSAVRVGWVVAVGVEDSELGAAESRSGEGPDRDNKQ
jgi:hypothetical protein